MTELGLPTSHPDFPEMEQAVAELQAAMDRWRDEDILDDLTTIFLLALWAALMTLAMMALAMIPQGMP